MLLKRTFSATTLLIAFIAVTHTSAVAAEFFRKQSGTTTIAAGSTTRTVTITAVDMSQSFLVFSSTHSDTSPTNFQIGGELTNSTTLSFERTGNTGTVSISWQIFEFEGGVSVQHGSTLNVARNTNVDVTINCIDLTKSFVLVSARKSGAQLGSDDGITANLTSSTNLRLFIQGAAGANMEEVYWQIVEYQAATVQKVTATLAAGSTTTTSTVSPAISNLAKAFVVSNHTISGDVNPDDLPRTELTNTTTVTYTRVGSTEAMSFVTYVIEFTDQSSVTRGTQNFASTVTAQNVSITAASSSGVIGSGNYGRQGSSSFATDDNPGHSWFTYQITSGTNLLISRATGTAGGNSSADAPWQIITFEDLNVQQKTFYSRASGAWETNTSWSFTPDGSSGAVPTGVYPRRINNVVIQTGHTITINSVTDNGPCSTSPDGLGRSNVGPFAASNLVMFYQTGDILINGTLTVTGIEMMTEGFTKIASGGNFNLTSSYVNLGFLEADAGSTLSAADDIILAGNSATIINTTSISNDDLIISFTNATLCGTGTTTLQNGSGSVVTYANGATVSQICNTFTVACTGVGCSGFPVVGTTTILSGNVGPGGIGNSTNNRLWLMANQQVYSNAGTTLATDNQLVQQWNDFSGNSRHASELTNQPTYRTNIVNGMPAIRFDNSDRLLSTGLTTANSASVFVVAQYSSLPSSNPGLVQGSPSGLGFSITGTDKVIGMWVSNTNLPWGRVVEADNNSVNIPQVSALSASTFFVLSNIISASTLNVSQYVNNVVSGSVTYDGTLRSWTDFGIGRQGAESWNGDIAEVVVYNADLNAAQQVLVSNYLSAKYTTPLSVANNVYTFDDGVLTFDHEVAGIGQASDGSKHIDAKGPGVVRMWNPNGLANSEFLMWGHDNGALSGTTSGIDGTVVAERLVRIWRVGESADVGTVSVSFDLSSLASPLGSNLRLLIDRDGDGFADNDVPPVVGSFINNTVVFSGVNFASGDRFTLGNTNASIPLPIELAAFNAKIQNRSVQLSWSTASEHNNDFFTIEKTQDAKDWVTIGTVKGVGNSVVRQDYYFTDEKPYANVSYYRLRQTDFDKKFTYSKVVRVDLEVVNQILVYPNPSSGTFTLTSDSDIVHLKFLNTFGSVMPISIEKQAKEMIIDPGDISPGVYFIQVLTSEGIKSLRVIKN